MTDDVSKLVSERGELLRRIAHEEIERHRERHGFLAAALDGSLATGALWPSSDLDFTLIPCPGFLDNPWVEWGQRGGIPWHKHVTYRRTLLDLMEGYPESFIRSAHGSFNSDANWLLDGLAVMEIVEDPDGLLSEVKAFVAARRFASEVWAGRREGFLQELRRLIDSARKAMDTDSPGAAIATLGGGGGFGDVAAQVWLEAGEKIYSAKEQDGTLKVVTQNLGVPEAHALYRRVIGVVEERAMSVTQDLLDLGEKAGKFYDEAHDLAPEGSEHRTMARVWEAWVRHLSHRLSLAPQFGHPAHLYQSLQRYTYEIEARPVHWAEQYCLAEISGAETLNEQAKDMVNDLDSIRLRLSGGNPLTVSAREALGAAEQLLHLTEQVR